MLKPGICITAAALTGMTMPSALAQELGPTTQRLETTGEMLLADVAVQTDPDGGVALPIPGWRHEAGNSAETDGSSTDSPSGTRAVPEPGRLALVHAAGAPLDATWIRAQFSANHMLGRVVGFDRIAALVQLINLAFISNGYPNSGVLLDGREDGDVLRLKLVSGHLAPSPEMADALAVSFRGNHHKGLDADFIRHRMRTALARPLNIRTIERDFRLLSDDPAIRTVNAYLVPGTQPGEAALALEVDPQPRFDLFTSYANNRSPSVGARRLGVGGFVRSLLRPGDFLSVQSGTTRGLTDFTGSYTIPLFSPKWAFTVRGGFNNAAVVDPPLLPLDIRSREFYIDSGVTRTLIARPLMPGLDGGPWRPAINLALGVFGLHREIRSSLLGQPVSFGPNSLNGRTAYDAMRLSLSFTRRSMRTVFVASLTGTFGLHETVSRRAGALPSNRFFSSAQLQLNYARRISPQLLELRLRFAGQFAGSLLNSAERFSIGGSDTVRGYRESLLLADHAAVGSIELAQPFDLIGRRGGAAAFRPGAFALSAFADGAYARNRLGAQPTPKSLASVGGRLVWTPADWISGTATYAHAMKKVAVAGNTDLQDRGFTFQLTFHPLGLVHAIGKRL